MDFTDKLEKAADARALEILGESQYNDENYASAKDGIIEDFKAGVEWHQEIQSDKNFSLVSRFQEYVNENFDLTIPDELVESFFDA
ncbi:hypothetical protein [Chryseobacterium sp.]|uniref:hypothetical protein n=1 Tax=Chryseobacterium sp. TaxID=1871047 RepID=UPI002FC6DC84